MTSKICIVGDCLSFGDTGYLLHVIAGWSSTLTLYHCVVSFAPKDPYSEKLCSLITPRWWNKSVSLGDKSHPYSVQRGSIASPGNKFHLYWVQGGGMGRIITNLTHGVFGTSFWHNRVFFSNIDQFQKYTRISQLCWGFILTSHNCYQDPYWNLLDERNYYGNRSVI